MTEVSLWPYPETLLFPSALPHLLRAGQAEMLNSFCFLVWREIP